MTKQGKLSAYRARQLKIIARGKYLKSTGVLNKVTRKIKNLEAELNG